MKILATFIIKYRLPILTVIVLITLFFAYQILHIEMYTVFEDLLPSNHPYIKMHREFKDIFGGANLVLISIEVKKGNIFNYDILYKVKKMTEAVEMCHGVNNYLIYSIARQKVKDMKATSWGIEIQPVMFPNPPKTKEGMEELKNVIYSNDTIFGKLVSLDSKAALITASFMEKRLDYKYIFDHIMRAADSLKDENTIINVAGEPILYGWMYYHLREISVIFIITISTIVLLLILYFRNIPGVIIPMLSLIVTAIWGVGFNGVMGYNFDPLILVVPFLISARTVSHSVQMTSRFFEEYVRSGDRKESARISIEGLLIPGLTSIITDAFGILVIIIAPIPILVRLGVVGTFWIITNIVSVLILAPIIFTYIPVPKKIREEKSEDLLGRTLYRAGKGCFGFPRFGIVGAAIIIVIWSSWNVRYLTIGDSRPGSPLLWPDAPFNLSTKHINDKFPGTNQLIIFVKGKHENTIKSPALLYKMEEFERYLRRYSKVGGTESIINLGKRAYMVFHNDDPRWRFLCKSRNDMGNIFYLAQEGTEPGDLDKWVNYNWQHGTIIAYLKDHKGDTIREIIGRAKRFIDKNPVKDAEWKLAGGLIGIVAAGNEVIAKAHEWNLFLILFITFLCCAIGYRSIIGGILFIVSTSIANFTTLAIMAYYNLGLNVNTIPVVTLGIGLGVDYGLYVVSRIKEEYEISKDLKIAIPLAISTAGKAVLFTALTITAGIIFWWFSPLRFQAEMGGLLTIVLLFNMLGGMFLLPALIYIIKPKFVIGRG
jgi:hypothetical protein